MQKLFSLSRVSLCILILFFNPVLTHAEDVFDIVRHTDVTNYRTSEDCAVKLTNMAVAVSPGQGCLVKDGQILDLANTYCFEVSEGNIKRLNPYGFLKMSSIFTANDLIKAFGSQQSLNFNGGFFSAGVQEKYLKSIAETERSYSLSYVQTAMDTVVIQPKGYGKEALNSVGKNIYEHERYSDFIQSCGNSFITQYTEGAVLLMSVNMQFTNKQQKEESESHIWARIKNMKTGVNIITMVQDAVQYAQRQRIDIIATVQAYQIGGDPIKLGKAMGQEPNSDGYYAVSCSLNDMSKCIGIANGILGYAANIFSSTDKDKFAVLGVNAIKFMPISWLGLK